MVLTAVQTTAFFENPDQLGIPHETMVQIQQEGIQAVADLADFDKQELQSRWRRRTDAPLLHL